MVLFQKDVRNIREFYPLSPLRLGVKFNQKSSNVPRTPFSYILSIKTYQKIQSRA